MTIDLDAPAAAPIRPRPRRRRALVAGVAVLAAAAVLVAVRLGSSPPPSHDFSGRLRWIASLVDAAPRGGVGAEGSFARDLAARVEELSRTSPVFGEQDDGWPPGGYRARVLFADDIDARRIALVALQPAGIAEARRRYAVTELLWLAGPRGASAEWLSGAVESTGPADTEFRVEPVAPFVSAAFGDPGTPMLVAVAPPSCRIATTGAADLAIWRDEPTGSYLVRRPRVQAPEYWRVTCDGVVREQRPAPRSDVAAGDLGRVLAEAEGGPDREQLGYQLAALYGSYGSQLLAAPRVLWSGPVALSPLALSPVTFITVRSAGTSEPVRVDLTVTIVATPAAGGGWIGSAWTMLRAGPGALYGMDGAPFATATDPDGLLAVRMDRWRQQVLVLAPGAATVRILSGGRTLDQATVTDLPVLLAPGADAGSDGLRVEALDATGSVIATTGLATTDPAPDLQAAWD